MLSLCDGPVAAGTNPMFIAPWRDCIYSVDMSPGQGQVTAWRVDQISGKLTKLNSMASGGESPCHLSIASTTTQVAWLLVANYGGDQDGGSVAVLPIKSDGSLGELTDVHQHAEGAGSGRQAAGHPHQAVQYEDVVFVPDLGKDSIVCYVLNSSTGKLQLSCECRVHAGAGPRHISFDEDNLCAYVINELDNTVTSLSVRSGPPITVELIEDEVSCLPEGWNGWSDHRGSKPFDFYEAPSHAAEIKVAHGHVYVSNRGHDSIAMLKNNRDGKLELSALIESNGRLPWTFEFVQVPAGAAVPSSCFMLVSNQFNPDLKDPGNIAVFSIDRTTGVPTPVGVSGFVTIPKCMCVAANLTL